MSYLPSVIPVDIKTLQYFIIRMFAVICIPTCTPKNAIRKELRITSFENGRSNPVALVVS